jgi:phosphoribosylglycinamide formyltransferase-1
MTVKVGILISGRGSNMVSLVKAMKEGRIPAEAAVVLSNAPDAPGLEKAEELGIPTQIVDHRESESRREHDEKMLVLLREAGVEWICLAGYMRILSPQFVDAFRNRILNIHPSLLPAFAGVHAQKHAWDYGTRVTGVTVHLVDEMLDHGPILAQRAMEVDPGETLEQMESRLLKIEHELYPEALALAVSGDWHLEGRRVVLGHA